MVPAPLVLLHGVGTSRGVWRRVLPLLGARRRTLAVDLPGFGDAPPLGPDFDLGEVADEVAGSALERAGGPFDLVGHSLGGAVAVVLARRRPDAVRRLVLLAPAGFSPRPRAVALAAGAGGEALVGVRRVLGSRLVGSPLARRVLLWSAVADGARLSVEDARFMLDASRGARGFRPAVEAVLACDLRPALAEVRAPLGLVRCDRDRVISSATMERLAAANPGAITRKIPGCGHVPQLEAPDELVAALEEILDGCPRSRVRDNCGSAAGYVPSHRRIQRRSAGRCACGTRVAIGWCPPRTPGGPPTRFRPASRSWSRAAATSSFAAAPSSSSPPWSAPAVRTRTSSRRERPRDRDRYLRSRNQGEEHPMAEPPVPAEGILLTHFIVSDDVPRSAAFYSDVLGGEVVMEGEPSMVKLANSWIIINVGGGPTDDKPEVILETPPDPNRTSTFLNIRVADIQSVYEEWRSRGAEFITPPVQHASEIRAYIRDPDGHLIEVGQTTAALD